MRGLLNAAALLWFCYDDFLARVSGETWVGDIPFWVWFVITLILCVTDSSD